MTQFVKRRMKLLLFVIVFNILILLGIVICCQQGRGIRKCSKLVINKGRMKFNIMIELQNWTLDSVADNQVDVYEGGSWVPRNCTHQGELLVVIPYRDRERHLIVLLGHLHPLLQQQRIPYTIYVVEQYGNGTFNKGRLMNAAFREAIFQKHFDCVVFHDVDLIPEDDRIPYSCPVKPNHLSVAIDTMKYRLIYPTLVGGVLVMRTEHYIKVNGYSNSYWGWGAEDDDMAARLAAADLGWMRPRPSIARYTMVKHNESTRNPQRHELLKNATFRISTDGLQSGDYYQVVSHHKRPLFTHLIVDIGSP